MDKINTYFEELKDFMYSNGIRKGDIVYVGSDMSAILLGARRELGIDNRKKQNWFIDLLIDCLIETVGDDGTLLFPNFTWAFCRGEPFDYRFTHGEIGVLNNYILDNRKDFVRTSHPIYNFMVWGNDSRYLQMLDNQDSWSEDSPFGYLKRNCAKQINLNVPFNKCITFQHYVEQSINAPYRYKKFFFGRYIDKYGIESERVYSMYVRDLSIESSPYLPEQFFTDAKVAKSAFFHDYKIIIMELEKIYNHIKNDLINNKGNNIYHFINYEPEWEKDRTHSNEIKVSSNQIIQICE